MSEQTKQDIVEIKKTFEIVKRDAEQLGERAKRLGDKEIKTKIEKVGESAQEIVKHIEKKSG
jgi:hypothetical protein